MLECPVCKNMAGVINRNLIELPDATEIRLPQGIVETTLECDQGHEFEVSGDLFTISNGTD